MDGQEYLDRISSKVQPSRKKIGEWTFKSKILLIIGVCFSVLVLFVIVGALLGRNTKNEKTDCSGLLLHLDNTSKTITKYQPVIKSSSLRSSSASLYSVLANTSNSITEYLTQEYKVKAPKDVNKKVTEKASADNEALEDELFKAKINGVLDRVFANKMAYEISLFMAEEDNLYKITKDDSLKEALDKSRNSLKNLYDAFDNFSETQ